MKSKTKRNLGIAGVLSIAAITLSTAFIISNKQPQRKIKEQRVLTDDKTIDVKLFLRDNMLGVYLENRDFTGNYSWQLDEDNTTSNPLTERCGDFARKNLASYTDYFIPHPGTFYFTLNHYAYNADKETEGNKQRLKIE